MSEWWGGSSTVSSPLWHSRSDTVEGSTNGDATERRSAYAKATADKYDPPSLLRATADKLRKYGDAAEAVRLRAELTKLVEKV